MRVPLPRALSSFPVFSLIPWRGLASLASGRVSQPVAGRAGVFGDWRRWMGNGPEVTFFVTSLPWIVQPDHVANNLVG